jgi:hypothetical protein
MLTKMRDILRTTWGRANASTAIGLPKLSGTELARSSWAKPIESYATVPDIYKEFFYPFFIDGRAFPYTVLTPSHERFVHKTSEKLICDFENEIYVLEKNGNKFEAQRYPLDGINYVEFKTALLASSIKICGVTSHGVQASSTLIFNSVTDYLFAPILKRMRRAKTNSTRLAQNSKQEQFDYLIKVNYKFMNYARRSLMGGEKVLQSVLQPEIRERWVTFLRKAYFRTVSPTHMIILTDRELILIQEEVARRKEDRYGGIWDYIPLRKIESLSLREKDGKLLVLSIQLPGSIRLELLFEIFSRGEVNQLVVRFSELKAGL